MMVEFEKRIAHLDREILELKASGRSAPEELARLTGALIEAERLYGFYKKQMVEKGRILPEPSGGENEKSISADGHDVGAGDNRQG